MQPIVQADGHYTTERAFYKGGLGIFFSFVSFAEIAVKPRRAAKRPAAQAPDCAAPRKTLNLPIFAPSEIFGTAAAHPAAASVVILRRPAADALENRDCGAPLVRQRIFDARRYLVV